MRLARLVASLGGVGHLRPAPGTWGSLAVLPIAWAGPGWALALAALCAAATLVAVPRLLAASSEPDPGWIVIDEAAGQSLALSGLAAGAGWAEVLAAFALFRVFDIAKPGPIGWADRLPGAPGVLLDDLLAGAAAALLLLAFAAET